MKMRRSRAVDAGLWALFFVAVAAIVFWSLGPTPPGAGTLQGFDKVLHGLAYMIATLLFLLAAVWRPGRPTDGSGIEPRVLLPVAVVAVSVGCALELGQGMLTSDREPELLDVVWEVLGVTGAVGCLLLGRHLAYRRKAVPGTN